MVPYQEKCRICGTAITIRDTYKKCSNCGHIEFRGEDYDYRVKLKPINLENIKKELKH